MSKEETLTEFLKNYHSFRYNNNTFKKLWVSLAEDLKVGGCAAIGTMLLPMLSSLSRSKVFFNDMPSIQRLIREKSNTSSEEPVLRAEERSLCCLVGQYKCRQ